MPSRTTTRSGRVVKSSSSNQSKLDALEVLARQRRGEKVDTLIKEDEPLFEEVNEEEWRRTRKGGFIVDPESDEEDGSDIDFIDDDDPEDEDERKRKRPKGGRSKHQEVNPRQRSMKSFLSSSASSSKRTSASIHCPVIPSSSKQEPVNEDDILSQMLFDVPTSRTSSAQKPLKILSRLSSSSGRPQPSQADFKPLKTKGNYRESASVKRPRMTTGPPSPSDDAGVFDNNWQADGDDFDDSLPANLPVIDGEKPSAGGAKFSDVIKAEANVDEDFDDDDEKTQDTGVKAVPLNEDLKSNLEFHDHEDGKKYTRFYWYDCCEDQSRNPGIVYLFGRIYATTAKRFVSCCTIVKNIQRTVYLLITDDSTYEQTVLEFTNIIAKRFKIKNHSCEKVTKKYAFSRDSKVPLIADYVKVDYPATQASLPADLRGETFSHVFNVNQSPMEKLILELKLRGPCWLRLIDPVAPDSQLTWTRIELVLERPASLCVDENSASLKAPYFCTFSLSLRTYSNPITHHSEIIAIVGMVNTSFNLDQCLKRTDKASGHFCIMTKPPSGHKELKMPYDYHVMLKSYKKTRFQLVDTERDLLLAFLDKFSNLDPDIVVGHDLLNFDYETLVMRMKVNKVGAWSKLARFKRTELPSTKAAFRYMFSGRVLCDIRSSAMELIHARSYDLTELCSQVLQYHRIEYNHASIVDSFKSSEGLIKLLDATWADTDNIFSILVELNVIPLALKITNITGNILSRTLAAGRSERNEYLLLHAFHEANFICPEKQVSRFKRKGANDENRDPVRKKAAYSGGLVLEPKSGYYDTCVLLMDFNSLYPSIIQEFNICFSTVKVPDMQGENPNAEIIAAVPDDTLEMGVLPAQLKNLVDGRRRVKRLLADSKSPDQKLMLDIEQKALKLTANSMYGCLGFEQSRFYAKHLASLVTFKGREILMSTKAMVEKLGYEVIYGDTDSLMINTKITDYDEVIQRGTSIKGEINRTFKLLEIDIDGVYKPLLLLKKKNYAGATVKKSPDGQICKSIETKGLDTVRRDRAVIAKEAGERVLSMILESDKEIVLIVEEIHAYLKQLGEDIKSEALPKEKFLISKQLNRNPEEYRETRGIGHVTLALRYNSDSKKTRKLKAGDTVEYVVCLDNTTESANQRAYTLDELSENPDLKLDYEYYLCQQVHPVMTRICDKLPITNAYVLAEMLGVEKSSLLHIKRDDTDGIKRDQLISKGEARFNSCRPLTIQCPNCNLPQEIKSRTRKNKEKKLELSLMSCPECEVRYAMKGKLVVVQIISLIRQLHLELYNSKFVCENGDCDYQTRNVFGPLTSDDVSTSSAIKAQPLCNRCDSPLIADMDDRKMDLQLSYIKHLLDARKECEQRGSEGLVKPTEDVIEMYESCSKEIEYALKCSFINNIDAYSMFSMICSGRELDSAGQHNLEVKPPLKSLEF